MLHRNPQGPAPPERARVWSLCRPEAHPQVEPRCAPLNVVGSHSPAMYPRPQGLLRPGLRGSGTENLARRAAGGLEGTGLEPACRAPPRCSGLLWAQGSWPVGRKEAGRAMSSVRRPNFPWAPLDSWSPWISAPCQQGGGGVKGQLGRPLGDLWGGRSWCSRGCRRNLGSGLS